MDSHRGDPIKLSCNSRGCLPRARRVEMAQLIRLQQVFPLNLQRSASFRTLSRYRLQQVEAGVVDIVQALDMDMDAPVRRNAFERGAELRQPQERRDTFQVQVVTLLVRIRKHLDLQAARLPE